MEFAAQNGFEENDIFNTNGGGFNKFTAEDPPGEEDLESGLKKALMDICARIMGTPSATKEAGILSKAASFFSGAVKAGVEIICKAVKVAVFKFGIELCAMSIKGLVDTMSGKGLQPPSIDTKGVFYNSNLSGGSTGNSVPADLNRSSRWSCCA